MAIRYKAQKHVKKHLQNINIFLINLSDKWTFNLKNFENPKRRSVGHPLTSTYLFQIHKQIKSEASNQMTHPFTHSLLFYSILQWFSQIKIHFLELKVPSASSIHNIYIYSNKKLIKLLYLQLTTISPSFLV